MNIISYEEFKNTDLYEDFIRENDDVGNLKVQVFTAYGAIPIENTNIVVYKDIEEYRVIFFQGITDSSGIISDISLPAPKMVTSNEETPVYTIYNMTAFNTGYESLKSFAIGMLGGVNVIQYVKMMPTITLEGVDNNEY